MRRNKKAKTRRGPHPLYLRDTWLFDIVTVMLKQNPGVSLSQALREIQPELRERWNVSLCFGSLYAAFRNGKRWSEHPKLVKLPAPRVAKTKRNHVGRPKNEDLVRDWIVTDLVRQELAQGRSLRQAYQAVSGSGWAAGLSTRGVRAVVERFKSP
jgi:hypothetical protein